MSLISLGHRIRLIKELGADILVVLKFTKALADLPPEKFVKNILIKRFGMREMYTSGNFYFGKGASAGVSALKKMSEEFGFKLRVVKSRRSGGVVVSSTHIRRLIVEGAIAEASRFLGRPVSILGTVVSGSKLAKTLGYPTANINPHHEAIPPAGVYAVRIKFAGSIYRGILNIGARPTFFDKRARSEPVIEVHIFGFNKRIYGKDLEILFVKKIRSERKFKSLNALIAQIKNDERKAKSKGVF